MVARRGNLREAVEDFAVKRTAPQNETITPVSAPSLAVPLQPIAPVAAPSLAVPVAAAPSLAVPTASPLVAPSTADLATMGLTAQQFSDLQKEVANMDLSKINIGAVGPVAGAGTSGLNINEADYMIGAPLSNKGNPTSTLRQSSNDFFVYDNQPVRLIDNRTGKVVFEGAGPADAKKASELAAQLTKEGGNKATWDIQTGPSSLNSMLGTSSSGWQTVAHEKKNSNVLGTIADIALPVAASLLVPGAGFLGTMLPAAAGSAVSSVAQGRSLGNTLLRAGLAGAGAGLGEAVFTPGVDALGSGITKMADTAIANLPGSVAGSTAGSALGSTAGAGLGSAAGSAVDDIIVTALTKAAPNIAGGALGSALGSGVPSLANAIAAKYPSYNPATEPKSSLIDTTQTPPSATVDELSPLTVTAKTGTVPPAGIGSKLFTPAQFLGGENAPRTQPSNETRDPELSKDELVITAKVPPSTNILPGALGGTAIADVLANAAAANAQGATNNPAEDRASMTDKQLAAASGLPATGGMTLADIGDYIRLAGLGTGLLGSLLGGGGSGGGSGVRYTGAGARALSPSFSAKLPTPSMPGASSGFAVRPSSEISTVNGQPRDWNTYGFGPEASFFNYVPQRGYSHGGEAHGEGSQSFAVRGPGDGRSDDIPAMLSDGEYVMDAESVALLGNGSAKAGAKALDRLRVNLRKHKGKKLAKGEFSVKAKRPEQYLAGGRI